MDNFIDLDYQYKKLIKELEKFKDKKKIIEAINLAKIAHKGQKRDEGQDYFIHPVRVANCLIFELSIKDSNLIIAGILHDVIEDSNTQLIEIKEKFGEKVANLIEKLTRNKEKETKDEKFQKLMKENDEIRLLKAVDWLDNLRSFPYRKDRDERFFRHIREASEMYLPLAESINDYITKEMKKIIKKLPKSKMVGS